MAVKENMRDPCSGGNVLYLDCINLSILVVILYYHFLQDVTVWRNWIKHAPISLYHFTYLHVTLQIAHNKSLTYEYDLLINTLKFIYIWDAMNL